jgi:VCBS repeat-containing protein
VQGRERPDDRAGGAIDPLLRIGASDVEISPARNSAPVAADDAIWFQEDMVINWWHTLLNNDRDADLYDSLSIVSVDTSGTSGHVVYDAATERLTYKAAALPGGAVAMDSFTYTVADMHGAQSTATVNIEVHGMNDAPVAANDVLALMEDGGINWYSMLLANDTDVDAGDVRTIVSVDTSGMDGTLIFDPSNHVLVYKGADWLDAGDGGYDSFTYTIVDSHGAESTATVSLIVTGENDAPVAADDSLSVMENGDTNWWATLLGNDVDPEGYDGKTIVSVDTSGMAGELVFDPSSQMLTYKGVDWLSAGEDARDSFTYTMADAHGVQSTATVNLIVTGEGDFPGGGLPIDDLGLITYDQIA